MQRAAQQPTPRMEKILWRMVYEVAAWGRDDATTLMNYGYAPSDGDEDLAFAP